MIRIFVTDGEQERTEELRILVVLWAIKLSGTAENSPDGFSSSLVRVILFICFVIKNVVKSCVIHNKL